MNLAYWFLWYVVISMFGIYLWGLYSGLREALVKKDNDESTARVVARLVLTLLCAGGSAGAFMILSGTMQVRINN